MQSSAKHYKSISTLAYRPVQNSSKADSIFLKDVVRGLSASPKQLPSKYFYDEAGSRLFDEICELEEYYPTRTEMNIMRTNIDEMVDFIGVRAMLIEYGSGSSLKTRILLEHLQNLSAYVPIDISKAHLMQSAKKLRQDFPGVEVLPVHADYSTEVTLPASQKTVAHKVVYFPGSTIGNFTPAESVGFLKRISRITDHGGGLLIGVDLKKDIDVLESAYNDAKGVTAAFNLNLLKRINRELDGDFDINSFEHEAVFNEMEGRIEMHLISKIKQSVSIQGRQFTFSAGESIHTENSYKYTLAQFSALAGEAGLSVEHVWTDPKCLFSVQYLSVI